jgi:hypothetical protein
MTRLWCRLFGHLYRMRKDGRALHRGLILVCARCGRYGSTWS